MDLSKFEIVDEPVFVHLKHPVTGLLLYEQTEVDGRNTDNLEAPVGVRVSGAESEVFKRHARAAANKSINDRQKRGKVMSAEEIEVETKRTLAACIVELVRIEWKGEKLSSPIDNPRFIELMPWAAEQVDTAMADRKLFMPALSKS